MSDERILSNTLSAVSKKDKRRRFQFRFWLDCMKDDELLLAEDLDGLKRKRTFQTTVRDALRLMLDLQQGQTTLLRVLFPGVVAQIEAEVRHNIDSPANTEFAAILAQRVAAHLAVRPPLPVEVHTPMLATAGQAAITPLMELEARTLTSAFVQAEASGTVSASETRKAFSAGFGDLFADDDDVWDN